MYQGGPGSYKVTTGPSMEENLAREMARMKMEREKQQREIEKICGESEELKNL